MTNKLEKRKISQLRPGDQVKMGGFVFEVATAERAGKLVHMTLTDSEGSTSTMIGSSSATLRSPKKMPIGS
ncbi:hypothetical protein [Arthrobacter sp. NPDC058192]|uniref:hypothetical protein n=1 Tax=Arthrobacter sp. NPDC058192 TaxID=3346372 RepID=UPI0036E4FAFA